MIIILNAPAGAGKDTIQQAIADLHEVSQLIFKKPMFAMAKAMLGDLGFAEFMDAYNNRERKEKPLDLLHGSSPRQFMIWLSESVIKPHFGDKHFGNLLYDDYIMHENDGYYVGVVSDGGFESETLALIDTGVPVRLVRLHRDGYTFAGDSRDYVSLPLYANSPTYDYQEFDVQLTEGLPVVAALDILSMVGLK